MLGPPKPRRLDEPVAASLEALAAIAGAVGVRPSRLLAEAEEAGAPDPGHAAAP